MSYVTNIVLFVSVGEDHAIQHFNALLEAEGMVKLKELCLENAGGNKLMEVRIFAAAFSFFDAKIISRCVENTSWEYPESVQLLKKNQDDAIFTSPL